MTAILKALWHADPINVMPTAAKTATGAGAWIDLTQYDGTGVLLLDCAAGAGTSPTLDLTFEESDDQSTITAVPSTALYTAARIAGDFTRVIDAAQRQTRYFEVGERKKYIREAHTIGGSNGQSFTYSMQLLAQKKYQT